MDIMEAIRERHSVRRYKGIPVTDEDALVLEDAIRDCNAESGLSFRLVRNEPRAFSSPLAKYGSFKGVTDYVAAIGHPGPGFEEKCGYYGEKIVLAAQAAGMNTCWVGLTYKKVSEYVKPGKGEKLLLVISVGYGETQGSPRRSKRPEDVSNVTASSPEWFKKGVEAALLAPTAVNQQKFRLELDGDRVKAAAGIGFYAKTDLGIVKCHFEAGSGKGPEIWA